MHNFRHIETVCDLLPTREDTLLAGENIFGVFDGAGSLVKFTNASGDTGGKIAAELAHNAFDFDGTGITHNPAPLDVLAKLANLWIRAAMEAQGIDTSKKVNLWCTTAAVVRMREKSFEWLQIGDSVILLIKGDKSFELLVPYHDHDQELLAICKTLVEKGEKDPHAVIVANGQAQALREELNVTYGDLTGEDEAMQWVRSGTRSLSDVDHILLFTDGLLIPKEDPREPNDWETTVRLFLKGGLRGLVRHIRKLQNADPFCQRYVRYKKHDDIAAIALSRKK